MAALQIVVVCLVGLVLVILYVLLSYFCCPEKEEGPNQTEPELQLPMPQENVTTRAPHNVLSPQRDSESEDELSPLLTFKQIGEITQNFTRELGEGRLGISYYGRVESGTEVAVKKMPISIDQDLKILLNEVGLLTKVSHRNLAKLVGFCPDGNALYLVYNYMPRGPLSQYVHGNSVSPALNLNWGDRLKIGLDVARGVEYLHTVCKPAIIHGAISSNNILLDENISAKVSEFGITKLSHRRNARSISIKESTGYEDAELENNGCPTMESDIYSFGIVLLEMICGRKPVFGVSRAPYVLNLADWAREQAELGDLEGIIDPWISNTFPTASVKKLANIALMCVKESRINRPTMKDVVLLLEDVVTAI